ncbi:MAG: histidine kinase, partial [Bacteroidota bacterium]
FNSLNAIQHYLHKHDQQAVNNYLSEFARLIRANMDVAGKPLASLEEELDRLELYLGLEVLRFGDRLKYQIEVAPDLDPDEILLPPMLIQPLVENSIWHGILPKNEEGRVIIQIFQEGDWLMVKVSDNGIGLDESLRNHRKPHHQSKGMRLIEDRLTYFSPEASFSIRQTFSPDQNSTGTEAILRFPESAFLPTD